jgi:hypothetical protein
MAAAALLAPAAARADKPCRIAEIREEQIGSATHLIFVGPWEFGYSSTSAHSVEVDLPGCLPAFDASTLRFSSPFLISSHLRVSEGPDVGSALALELRPGATYRLFGAEGGVHFIIEGTAVAEAAATASPAPVEASPAPAETRAPTAVDVSIASPLTTASASVAPTPEPTSLPTRKADAEPPPSPEPTVVRTEPPPPSRAKSVAPTAEPTPFQEPSRVAEVESTPVPESSVAIASPAATVAPEPPAPTPTVPAPVSVAESTAVPEPIASVEAISELAPQAPDGSAAHVVAMRAEERAGEIVITIDADGRIESYRDFRVPDPERVAVDLRGLTIAPRVVPPTVASGAVHVRAAQFKRSPPIVRVVLDLTTRVAYRVVAEGRSLSIVVRKD